MPDSLDNITPMAPSIQLGDFPPADIIDSNDIKIYGANKAIMKYDTLYTDYNSSNQIKKTGKMTINEEDKPKASQKVREIDYNIQNCLDDVKSRKDDQNGILIQKKDKSTNIPNKAKTYSPYWNSNPIDGQQALKPNMEVTTDKGFDCINNFSNDDNRDELEEPDTAIPSNCHKKSNFIVIKNILVKLTFDPSKEEELHSPDKIKMSSYIKKKGKAGKK